MLILWASVHACDVGMWPCCMCARRRCTCFTSHKCLNRDRHHAGSVSGQSWMHQCQGRAACTPTDTPTSDDLELANPVPVILHFAEEGGRLRWAAAEDISSPETAADARVLNMFVIVVYTYGLLCSAEACDLNPGVSSKCWIGVRVRVADTQPAARI